MSPKPKIIVSVTSDLVTDQRVHRSCKALLAQGFDVMLVGRKLPSSPEMNAREYNVKRFNLLFYKGPLFYATFNTRLFFMLLFTKANALMANDLDTLLANFLASLLKRIPLLYDSHEFYTGVPELEHRPFVKNAWLAIERRIFPKLKTVITVNDSIANLYEKLYGKKLIVIRNVPLKPNLEIPVKDKLALRKQLSLPMSGHLIILQGSGINIQRGAEEAVEAMQYLDHVHLVLLGGGDVMPVLKSLVEKLQLEKKIIFLPRMKYHDMMQYTMACDIGLTLDKDTNINYRFSLPNKIFDYFHAGLPVLASRLTEVEKIITRYNAGMFIDNHQPQHIASKIQHMLSSETELARWRKNAEIAASELNWEVEQNKFPNFIDELN